MTTNTITVPNATQTTVDFFGTSSEIPMLTSDFLQMRLFIAVDTTFSGSQTTQIFIN